MEMMKLREPIPPKTDSPSSGDGSDNMKVLILARCFVKAGQTVLPSMKEAFEEIGTPLLGGYVERARCVCGKGCEENTIFGLVLPRSMEAIANVGLFYMSIRGTEIKDTNDPDLQPGKWSEHLE